MRKNLDVFSICPSVEPAGRRFASLGRVLRGEFPWFIGTLKVLRLPAAHPPHFVAFAWRYPRVHSFFSLPGGRVRRRGLELVTRYLQPGSHGGDDRISQVPGEPKVSVRHVQSTPAGLLAPDRYSAAARPRYPKSKGSREWSFDAQ
jgi:hypothetical protein